MLREPLITNSVGAQKGFRWRSHEISRLEGLSDAVFAFAVTLLIVSLEVPKTFTELMEIMRGFVAFAISFTLLFYIWYNQYLFFRRYGLQDAPTIVWNGVLLFVVLFYVYPLKFLWSFLTGLMAGHNTVRLPDASVVPVLARGQVVTLMVVYGLGYAAVFTVFLLMHLHAWRKRAELGLNEIEKFDTIAEMQACGVHIGVSLASVAVAAAGGERWTGVAGMVYFAIGILRAIQGAISGRRRCALKQSAA